jgi:lipoprotein-anchoring transpeptidase ErfK/SrfK
MFKEKFSEKLEETFKNKRVRIFIYVSGSVLLLFLIIEITGYILAVGNRNLWKKYLETHPTDTATLQKLDRSNQQIHKQIDRLAPRGTYIVIDTALNTLYIKNGNRILQQAIVSCGSGSILQEPDGNRRWVFDTPRGEFQIQSKLKKPVWVKPDWAFIEEGLKIPKDQKARIEPGVLGDYALGFGSGFFIHGTLYTRMLGRNVTHGCIRVGDNDLENLFKNIPVGAKLFIF